MGIPVQETLWRRVSIEEKKLKGELVTQRHWVRLWLGNARASRCQKSNGREGGTDLFSRAVHELVHQLNDRHFRPLFLQISKRRIHEWPEIWRDHNVLASRLIDEVGDAGSRIPGGDHEGDALCADDSERGGGIRECVWASRCLGSA